MERELRLNEIVNLYAWNDGELTEGMPIRTWRNKKTGKLDNVVFVGDQHKGAPVGRFTVLPISKAKWPLTADDKARVLGGSIKRISTDGVSQTVVQTLEEEDRGAIYVWVRTGFTLDRNGDVQKDLYWRVQTDQDIVAPGSFSLEGEGSVASGEEELTREQAAERVKALASPDHPLLRAPGVRHDVYRIGRGGSILIREVSGKLSRLANEENGDINVYDATEMAPVFEVFASEQRKAAKARRAAQRANRQEKESNPSVDAAVAPSGEPETIVETQTAE